MTLVICNRKCWVLFSIALVSFLRSLLAMDHLLLLVQHALQFLDLDVVASVLHSPCPFDLAIDPDELTTVLALLSGIREQGHQRVSGPDQCSHQTVRDIIRFLPEAQVASHAEGIIRDA